jgi:hypothetical protein
VIARPWSWVLWSAYAAFAVAWSVGFGIVTHFVVEDIVVWRDQGIARSIEESFDRVEQRCAIANEFALPALVLSIVAFAFVAFMIRKYFAPRWFA